MGSEMFGFDYVHLKQKLGGVSKFLILEKIEWVDIKVHGQKR